MEDTKEHPMTATTMTPVEFLRARLDEDEEAWRLARKWSDREWHVKQDGRGDAVLWDDDHDLLAWGQYEGEPGIAVLGLAARFDPQRVRAEVEAKRRIVDAHPPTDPFNYEGDRYCRRCLAPGSDVGYPDEWVQDYYPCPTIRLLALPYADHPDYRDEWRP